MSKRDEVPFTNASGQVINPGDDVLVVTVCTGSVYTYTGKYLGMRGKSVQALVEDDSYTWVDSRTGQAGSYYNIPSEFRKYQKSKRNRISTLQRNRVYKIAA